MRIAPAAYVARPSWAVVQTLRQDVWEGQHRSALVGHPVETLSVRMRWATWKDCLAELEAQKAADFWWLSPAEREVALLAALDLPQEALWQVATLYGLPISSVTDPAVPYGRAAVGCDWSVLLHDRQGLRVDAQLTHPMEHVVERSPRWQLGIDVQWLRMPHDRYPTTFSIERGFPFEEQYVLHPDVTQLVCTWQPKKETQ